jgi:hypothetical protein
MALEIPVSALAQNHSLMFINQIAVAGWGLLIIAVMVLILPALIIKRKRKIKNANLLIYHNRQQEPQQQPPEQWKKAKTRIEKLLYEITEHQPINEPVRSRPIESLNETGQYIFDNIKKQNRTKSISINKIAKSGLKSSRPPLDVKELQNVATLAKRLHSRHRHRITT